MNCIVHYIVFFFFLSLSSVPVFAENAKPFVVPELSCWQGGEGWFSPSGRIVVATPSLSIVAEDFAHDYMTMFGCPLQIVKGKPIKGDFVLSLSPKRDKVAMGNEEYQLEIGDCLFITAATSKGAFWATRTLLQLSELNHSRCIPRGTAIDAPAYPIRGLVLDCGRKYIPASYLKNLIKVMAYYKLNALQIHLNDNGFKEYFDNDWQKTPGAFRLESDYFPGLAATDGMYTKQQFIDLQQQAERVFLDIIPEIDVPAHSLAFSHYRKELGSEEYGMDHLDLNNPHVIPFLDSPCTEYCSGASPVFRGRYVHIGTDEYSNRDPEVVERFRSLTDHLIRKVESFGKQPVVWCSLKHAQGRTPVKVENVVMEMWSADYGDPIEMKDSGYSLLSVPDSYLYIVPSAGYYYDYLDDRFIYESYTPAQMRAVRLEERDPQLLGGMFALWNDHCGNGITVKDIHHRLFPAIQTFSTKTWTADYTSFSWESFDFKRQFLSEAPGVNELARILPQGIKGTVRCPIEQIKSNTPIDWLEPEIGYDYTVTFTLHAEKVNRGDVLFVGPSSVFYLASPKSGRLAFEREGYLNEFDYFVPRGRDVKLTICGTSRETRLYVDEKIFQVLRPLAVTTAIPEWGLHEVPPYPKGSRIMYYQRTLVFPLQRTGHFHGAISGLSVSNFVPSTVFPQ